MEERTRKSWRWNEELQCHEEVNVPTGKFKFTDEDRKQIVSEYLQSHEPASRIRWKGRGAHLSPQYHFHY